MNAKVDLRLGNREMLPNSVCSLLRQAILKGDFKQGERLVQTELAEQIGVSRMPIREALKTLEMEGLVTLEPHRGAVVRAIKKEDIEEIYELRAILEPLALTKSMLNLSEEDLESLKSYHKKMKETENGEAYVEYNREFHRLLFSRCESPRLLSFIETISHGFAQDTPQIIPGQISKSNQEHEKILGSILKGEKEQAARYLAEHISRTSRELIVAMETKDFQ